MIVASAPELAEELSEIARAAKAYWEYPREWLDSWDEALRIRRRDFALMQVFHVEVEGRPVAWCAVATDGEVARLEHLWVSPPVMGRGHGRRLLERAMEAARDSGCQRLRMVSDPHATAFYQRFGARRTGWEPSTIPGRRLPVLEIPLRPSVPRRSAG